MSDDVSLPDHVLVPERPTKVFGVGLHKTSTSSLANALYILGYHVGGTFSTGDFRTDDELHGHVLAAADHYDAVQDMPWPAFFRMLDEHFPDSKFVLTVRDPERWLSSVVTHFGSKDIASHTYIYGVPTAEGNEDVYLDHFRRHNRDVEEYFGGRPGDLLVMDIGAGDGWRELCEFLGVPVPLVDFPHQNPASGRRRGRVQRRLRREAEAAARWARVPTGRIVRDRVRAEEVWGAVQLLCRRFDALVGAIEQVGDDPLRHRLEGLLRSRLDDHLTWVVDVGASCDVDLVRYELAHWRLGSAWQQLALATRCWAGVLVDEGFGVRDPDGDDARPAVRRCVNDGIAGYERIVDALDPSGRLQRPVDGLRPL